MVYSRSFHRAMGTIRIRMRNKVLLAAALVGFSSTVLADQPTLTTADHSKSSKAVRLSDAELDQVTAGAVLAIVIVPPTAMETKFAGKFPVIIGSPTPGDGIFGLIVTDRGYISIPGGR